MPASNALSIYIPARCDLRNAREDSACAYVGPLPNARPYDHAHKSFICGFRCDNVVRHSSTLHSLPVADVMIFRGKMLVRFDADTTLAHLLRD